MPSLKNNPASLLADVPYDRVTKWTADSFGIGRDEFGKLVRHLMELEAASAVDIVSMSHDLAPARGKHVRSASFAFACRSPTGTRVGSGRDPPTSFPRNFIENHHAQVVEC